MIELLLHCYRFVYTDEAHLNADNVLHVLYTAKKYIITNLAKKCAEFLEENLSADTAANLLEQSMMFDEKDLKNKVLTKIEQEASAVLSSDDFPKLSKEALREVLQLNLQITSEMKVFEACMQWAENKCQQLQITTDGANLREVLGDNFSLIRFPTMTADDISDSVLPRDILTTHEGLQIFRYLTVTSKPENLPFPTEPRPNPTPRLPIEPRPDPTPRSLLIPAPYVQLQGTLSCLESCTKNTSLNCTVSRSIKIKGIIVHAMGGGIQLSVTLTQKGKTLLKYDNTLTRSSKRCTVDANDARVKAGSLLVEIKLKFTNYYFHDWNYNFEASSPTTRNLSDKFVSIDFNPVAENLLLGVEYSPM